MEKFKFIIQNAESGADHENHSFSLEPTPGNLDCDGPGQLEELRR